MSTLPLRIDPLPPIPAGLPGDPITGNTGGSSGGGQAGTSLQLSYYGYDHLGNTRMVFHTVLKVDEEDPTYVPEYLADYYPYGKILREWLNCTGERYLTTQHERDIETGYDYRGARFYDSDLGRFLSVDPLAAEYAGWSGYHYVLGNPVLFVDPSGMEVVNADKTLLNERRDEQQAAQNIFDQTREVLGGVAADAKKGDFTSQADWETFNTARKALNAANRNLDKAKNAFNQSQAAIDELAYVDPDAFQALDNLVDANGNKIDVLITSRENIAQPGQTLFGFDSATNTIYSNDPNGGGIARNAFQVQLDSGTSDPGRVLAHEGGHVRDIASNPSDRWNKRVECAGTNCRTDIGHWFVVPARQAEQRFVSLRAAIKD